MSVTSRRGTGFGPDGKTIVYGAAWGDKPVNLGEPSQRRVSSRSMGNIVNQ